MFAFGALQTPGYTVILQITSADQSQAPPLSLPFYQRSPFFCIRQIPPPDPFLPTIPQARQRRREKTGYSCGIMVPMLFPQDPYTMEDPQEPGLGDYSPRSHIHLRFSLKYEKC